MLTSNERIISPWTPEQVKSLNEYQKSPLGAYYCEIRSSHKPMVATERSWICIDCDSRAYWCYDVAADWSWKKRLLKPPPSTMTRRR